jgi:hypothetical protein
MRNDRPGRSRAGPARDRRGQSIALDYTLSLAVGFLLITGLIIAAGDYVTDQRNRAQESELRVVGQQVAADIEAADRLAVAASTNADVRLERTLPGTVARSGYTIQVVEDEDPYLVLASDGSDVSVRVELANQTALVGTTIAGGRIVVDYTSSDELELKPGDRYA